MRSTEVGKRRRGLRAGVESADGAVRSLEVSERCLSESVEGERCAGGRGCKSRWGQVVILTKLAVALLQRSLNPSSYVDVVEKRRRARNSCFSRRKILISHLCLPRSPPDDPFPPDVFPVPL